MKAKIVHMQFWKLLGKNTNSKVRFERNVVTLWSWILREGCLTNVRTVVFLCFRLVNKGFLLFPVICVFLKFILLLQIDLLQVSCILQIYILGECWNSVFWYVSCHECISKSIYFKFNDILTRNIHLDIIICDIVISGHLVSLTLW